MAATQGQMELEPESKYQDIFSSRYCRQSPLIRFPSHLFQQRPLSKEPEGDPGRILSERNRVETWRRLWCWLGRAELEAGLAPALVTEAAVGAMEAAVAHIDWPFARAKEAETRHDVMAHIAAFEKAAPQAPSSPRLRLGAGEDD